MQAQGITDRTMMDFLILSHLQFCSSGVQSRSGGPRVSRGAARQASLSITIFRSSLRLKSIDTMEKSVEIP